MFSTKLLNNHEQQIVTAHIQNRRTSHSQSPQCAAAPTTSKYGVKYKSSRSMSLNANVANVRSSSFIMKQHKTSGSKRKLSNTPVAVVPNIPITTTTATGSGQLAPVAARRFYSFKAPKRLDVNGQPLRGSASGGSLHNFVNNRNKKCVVNGGAVSANVAAGRTSFRIGGPKTNSVSRRVTKMVIIVSLIFLMLNLPLHVFNIYISVRSSCSGQNSGQHQDLTQVEGFLTDIIQAMFFSSFSCNFLLYSISGVTFRTEIHRLLMKLFCLKKSLSPIR
jgi:hypothetical protein